MADLALRWDATAFAADLAVEANDLVTGEELKTAVLLSLFTDRRAEDGDQLPAGATDRRGWWADSHPVVVGDRIGSRLWLLAREKQTPAVLAQAEKFAKEALRWLTDDRVAERIEVTAEAPRDGVLGLTVDVLRPRADPVTYRFDHTWDDGDTATTIPMPPPVPDHTVVTLADAFVVSTSGDYLTDE